MKHGLVIFVIFVMFGLAAGAFAFFAGWVCARDPAGDATMQIPCMPIAFTSGILFFFYIVVGITVGRNVTQDTDMDSSPHSVHLVHA